MAACWEISCAALLLQSQSNPPLVPASTRALEERMRLRKKCMTKIRCESSVLSIDRPSVLPLTRCLCNVHMAQPWIVVLAVLFFVSLTSSFSAGTYRAGCAG